MSCLIGARRFGRSRRRLAHWARFSRSFFPVARAMLGGRRVRSVTSRVDQGSHPSVSRQSLPPGRRCWSAVVASAPGSHNRVGETENIRRAVMAAVTIRQLLDAGVHFGHQTRRWNPKVKRFILTERSGIHIIDLQQSLAYIDKAYDFVKERWLGGLLTNFQTVSKRLGRMKELEEIDYDDTTQGFTKKELLLKKRELTKLQKSLGGIRTLQKAPSAIWVIDPIREHLAIDEARKLGIPVVGILDSNA